MSNLGGSYRETFHTSADPDAAAAHFVDLAAIEAATRRAEKVEQVERVGDDALAFVMAPHGHAGTTFQPRYTIRYQRDGRSVRWQTVDGNLRNDGGATFAPAAGGGTTVTVEQTIGLDIQVNRFVAAALSPMVSRMVAPAARRYVEAMLAALA